MNPDFWNEKYRTNDHLYSDRPNTFLQAYYEKQKDLGAAFIPGDGDGRNGLWLARQGFEVEVLDYSEVAVKPGGSLLIEVFSKDQLGKSSGGPKDSNLLFSTDTFEGLVADFEECQVRQIEYELNEGPLHTGICSVINIMALGRKNAPPFI